MVSLRDSDHQQKVVARVKLEYDDYQHFPEALP
jgi:hypothetical protein